MVNFISHFKNHCALRERNISKVFDKRIEVRTRQTTRAAYSPGVWLKVRATADVLTRSVGPHCRRGLDTRAERAFRGNGGFNYNGRFLSAGYPS